MAGKENVMLPNWIAIALLLGSSADMEGKPVLVRSNEQETVVSLVSMEPTWEEVIRRGTNYTAVKLPGAESFAEPGEPMLPVYRFAVAVPPGRTPQVYVNISSRVSFRDVTPPPAPLETIMPRRRGEGMEPRLLEVPAEYSASTYPKTRGRVVARGRIRSLDVAYIEVCPFEYFPRQELLCLDQNITVIIRTEPDPAVPVLRRKAPEEFDPMEPVLSRLLLNYKEAGPWRQGPPQMASRPLDHWDPPENAFKILVDHPGFYSISGQELADAGVPLGEIDPTTIQLLNGREEVPVRLEGTEDGSLDHEDALEFVGWPVYREDTGNRLLPVGGRYTETNVYWFTWGTIPGLRMGERVVEGQGQGVPAIHFRQQVHLERDLNPFVPDEGAISGDRFGEEWFWGPPLTPGDGKVDYQFSLQGIAPVSDPVHMRISLRGYTHPDSPHGPPHHYGIVYLNDIQVAHLHWYATDEKFYDSRIDPLYNPEFWGNESTLITGENWFSVDITGQTDYTWFDGAYTDWFELDYWRAYIAEEDSLAFFSPQQHGSGTYQYAVEGFSSSDLVLLDLTHMEVLEGFDVENQGNGDCVLHFLDSTGDSTQYLALSAAEKEVVAGIVPEIPSDLDGMEGAEFVIITHEDLVDEARRLALGRTFHRRPVMSTVIDVQDIYDEYNYGVFDPRAIHDFLADAYVTWEPPPAFVLLFGDASWDYKLNSPDSDPDHKNFVPSFGNPVIDDFFANVDDQGGADSLLPDLYLSRIPVENADTARIVVDKLLSYPIDDTGSWRENVLLIAGGYLQPNGYDSRSAFESQCRLLSDRWVLPEPAHYQSVFFFRPESTHFEDEFETTEDESLQVLFNEVGTAHATYIGHGASWTWETMFWASDVENDLTNTTMLPMVNSMTCHTGRFANPEIDSFGEIWQWQPHGSMGFFGSTGWGNTNVDFAMADRQLEVLFRDQERVPIVAILLSKLDPRVSGSLDHPMHSPLLFLWIGDPLLPLALAERPDWVLRDGDIMVGPQPIVAGDSVEVSIVVRNLGIDPGPGTLVRLFDAEPDSGGNALADLPVPALGIEESTTVSWNWVVPDGLEQREIWAWVNPDTAQQEAYRNDNTSSTSFQVLEPIPDLTLTDSSLWIIPAAPEVMDSLLTVMLAVSNQGTGSAPGYGIQLTDSSLSSGTTNELADFQAPALERGKSDTFPLVWAITDLDAGDHLIRAVVDWRGVIDELDETNNSSAAAVHIATRAELEAVALWISNTSPPEGDSLYLRGSWSNTGEAEASEFRILLTHGHPDSADMSIIAEKTVVGLAGGGADTLSGAWSTMDQVGQHRFYLTVDTEDQVSELDEANNSMAQEVEVVTGADLLVAWTHLEPVEPVEGDSSWVAFSIRNAGMIDADSFEVLLVLDEEALKTWRVALPGRAQMDFNHAWLWERGASAGDHSISIDLDTGDEIQETNEENNTAELQVHVMTLADLAVTLEASHDQAVEGDLVSLFTMLTNEGDAPVHTVAIKWWRSTDAGNSWEPFDSLFLPEFNGGGARVETTSVLVEAGVLDFRVTVSTPVEESTLENNQAHCTVTVRAKYPPDLVMRNVRFVEDTVVVGENAVLVLEVGNNGEIAPDSAWVEVWKMPGDSLAGAWELPIPEPGDTVSTRLEWPATHGASSWRTCVSCMPADSFPENNSATIVLVGVWPAELMAVNDELLAMPPRPLAGDTVSVSLTVANTGEQLAALYTVALFRGNPSSGQADTAELLATVTPDVGLAPGEERPLELFWATPDEPGRHELYAWIDAAQIVPERDESNNLLSTEVEILARDFSLARVVPIPSPAPGHTEFFVESSHEAEVTISIYTPTGRLVDILGPIEVTPQRHEGLEWQCRDRDGDRVANGVYLYRVEARSLSSRTEERISAKGKILVIR